MTISKSDAMKKIRQSITRFDKACQQEAVSGSYDRIESFEITLEYKAKRKALEALIEKILDEGVIDDSRGES